jgi:hypothetical protein
MKSFVVALATIVVSVVAGTAESAPIPNLCNTGQPVGCSGTLADGSLDPNYTIVTGPLLFTGPTKVVGEDGFPIGPWAANDSNSKWIGPGTADADSNADGGAYTYQIVFSLAGLDASTASISGLWGVDDTGVINLNGASTGNTITTIGGFSTLTPFSITSGFSAGVNTLDFVVTNGGGPTGLRVDDIVTSAQATDGVVPEPATLILLGSALMSAAARTAWRRRG